VNQIKREAIIHARTPECCVRGSAFNVRAALFFPIPASRDNHRGDASRDTWMYGPSRGDAFYQVKIPVTTSVTITSESRRGSASGANEKTAPLRWEE